MQTQLCVYHCDQFACCESEAGPSWFLRVAIGRAYSVVGCEIVTLNIGEKLAASSNLRGLRQLWTVRQSRAVELFQEYLSFGKLEHQVPCSPGQISEAS